MKNKKNDMAFAAFVLLLIVLVIMLVFADGNDTNDEKDNYNAVIINGMEEPIMLDHYVYQGSGWYIVYAIDGSAYKIKGDNVVFCNIDPKKG